MDDWSPGKIAPIFLSGLLAAILTHAVGLLRDFWTKQEEAKTSSMFLTLALEAYADSCATREMDIGNHDRSGGHSGHAWATVPDFPEFSDKTNWRAIGVPLSMRVLECRARVITVQGYLEGILEFQGAEETVEETAFECIKLARHTLGVADALRGQFKLGERVTPYSWNVSEYADRQHEKMLVRRAADAETGPSVTMEPIDAEP